MEKLLLEAAELGQAWKLRLLIRLYKCNINYFSFEGNTPLIIASYKGHYDIVNTLIQHRANINHVNVRGKTALMMAAKEGHLNVARVLLKSQKYTIDYYNENNESALTEACSGGHVEMVYLLLKYRHETSPVPYELQNALLKAITAKSIVIVKMLKIFGCSVNKNANLDESPLTMSVINNSVDILKLLIDYGANVEETNGQHKTPLQLAVKNGYKNMVVALLHGGADIHAVASKKRYDKNNSIRVVSEPGAVIIYNGYSLLMVAAKHGFYDIGRILIDNGANVNTIAIINSCSNSFTALKIAVIRGSLFFVDLLLSRQAYVNSIDLSGNIPLWYATKNGHIDVMKLLYVYGANVNHKVSRMSPSDITGASCLLVAIQYGRLKIVRWLAKRVTIFPTDNELSLITEELPLDVYYLWQSIYVECFRLVYKYRAKNTNKHTTYKFF